MKNSILIKSTIEFKSYAEKWVVSWPLKKNFRTSFWIKDSNKTCPCEIQSNGEIVQINKEYTVTIMLPKIESISEKLSYGSLFEFGLKVEPIGIGKVIEIVTDANGD